RRRHRAVRRHPRPLARRNEDAPEPLPAHGRQIFRSRLLGTRDAGVAATANTASSGVSARITAPAPMTLRLPTATWSRIVALMPTNDSLPTRTSPAITTCDVMKHPSSTTE